ncbi:hypothetical protein TNCV_2466451 [Trichonephila clavipes]|nr:hypothetical protein TNCV_2466451 [Trichonephila clavipes]
MASGNSLYQFNLSVQEGTQGGSHVFHVENYVCVTLCSRVKEIFSLLHIRGMVTEKELTETKLPPVKPNLMLTVGRRLLLKGYIYFTLKIMFVTLCSRVKEILSFLHIRGVVTENESTGTKLPPVKPNLMLTVGRRLLLKGYIYFMLKTMFVLLCVHV